MKLDAGVIILGLLFLVGGKKAGAGTPAKSAAASGPSLLQRANQAGALAWAALFSAHGMPGSVADALARWAGIESAGIATAVSRLGERGLLQCLEKTALQPGGPYSQSQWAALSSRDTSRDEQAALAIRLYEWLWHWGRKRLANPPGDGSIDSVWYAKLAHARPKAFTDFRLTGNAAADAEMLRARWLSSPALTQMLLSANVVAWNDTRPPKTAETSAQS